EPCVEFLELVLRRHLAELYVHLVESRVHLVFEPLEAVFESADPIGQIVDALFSRARVHHAHGSRLGGRATPSGKRKWNLWVKAAGAGTGAALGQKAATVSEELGGLDGVGGGALAEVVAGDPEVEGALVAGVATDAADEDVVLAGGVDREGV